MEKLPNTHRHPMVATAPRVEAFLRELVRYGSMRAAARAITPPELGYSDPSSAFFDLRRRDLGFRAACDAAIGEFVANLETYAIQFATGKLTIPHFHEGKITGHSPVINSASASVLLRLLARHSPDWIEGHRTETTIRTDGGESFRITPSEYAELSQTQQRHLIEIAEAVAAQRARPVLELDPSSPDFEPRPQECFEMSAADQRRLELHQATASLSAEDAATWQHICS